MSKPTAAAAPSGSIPARLLDAFGPSNYLYTFDSRVVNAVPEPAVTDRKWQTLALSVYQSPLITFVVSDPNTQPPPIKSQLSIDSLVEDRKRFKYSDAQTEVYRDCQTVRSADAKSAGSAAAATAQHINPYSDIISAGPYAYLDAYAMAEIDHFHCVTPPVQDSKSSATHTAPFTFVDLSAGGGFTEYVFNRLPPNRVRGWGYAFAPSQAAPTTAGAAYNSLISSWRSAAAQTATKYDATATPPNFAVHTAAATDPLGWNEIAKFSSMIDSSTNKTGVHLITAAPDEAVALDAGAAQHPTLSAERALMFDVVMAISVLSTGGSFVCLLPAQLFAPVAVPSGGSGGGSGGDTAMSDGNASSGAGYAMSPLLISVLYLCYTHFGSVAIQPLVTKNGARVLVCREFTQRTPKSVTPLLMWYSKYNKWSGDAKNTALNGLPPPIPIDGAWTDPEFSSFVIDAHLLTARYELYQLLTIYRTRTEP